MSKMPPSTSTTPRMRVSSSRCAVTSDGCLGRGSTGSSAMNRPGAGTALPRVSAGEASRDCSINAACVAFLETLPAMSSVESSAASTAGFAAAWLCAVVLVTAGAAGAGAGERAARGANGTLPARGVKGSSLPAGSGVSTAALLPIPAASR
jgi:hypothetical protein